MRRLAVALVVLALAACAGSNPQPVVVGGGGVAILITPAPEKLPYDPRSARLAAATEQLTALAGHPIEFQIDAALLDEWRSSFEESLIAAIEHIAIDLQELKDKSPKTFEHGAPLFARIECHYGILAPDEKLPVLDTKTRTIVITRPAHSWSELVPEALVRHVLTAEYDAYIASAYGTLGPDQVPVAERAAYFEFVTRYWERAQRRARERTPEERAQENKRPAAEVFATSERAETILKVIRLTELVSWPDKGGSDEELAQKMHAWLLSETSFFGDAYNHHADLVKSASPQSTWHRAEAAWVKWALAELPQMTPEEQHQLAKAVYVRTLNSERGSDGEYYSFAFPGVDKVAWGLAVFDAWAKAGHPDQNSEAGKLTPLEEFIVCPSPLNAQGNRSLGPHCDYDFYRFALSSEDGKRRVFDAIAQRNDPDFTLSVFLNAHRASSNDAMGGTVAVWRALEGNAAAWTIGAHVIADDYAETSDRQRLTDEVRRLWRAHPERRGSLLYILAQMDRYGNNQVDWKDIPRALGGPIGASELASYLHQGHRAMALAHVVWPALAPGFSRAEPIVHELDAYIANPLTSQYRQGDPESAVHAIVQRLCDEHAEADLARLHAYFTQRVQSHPGERFSDIVDDTEPGQCRAPAHVTPHPRKPVPGAPGVPIGPPAPPRRGGRR